MIPLSFLTGMESLPPGRVQLDLPAGPVIAASDDEPAVNGP